MLLIIRSWFLKIVRRVVEKAFKDTKHPYQTYIGGVGDGCLEATGKVIIMTRVDNRDVVKIFDIEPELSKTSYKKLEQVVRRSYGARVTPIDSAAARVRSFKRGG